MKPVKVHFILNPEHNQHTSCNAHRKANDIDERIKFKSQDVSDRDLEIILQHALPPIIKSQ
jgi:hypothetical protein